MKTKIIVAVSLCVMMFLLVGGCKQSDDVQSPLGVLLQYNGCKQFTQSTAMDSVTGPLSSATDCIEFVHDGQSTLLLKHINAGFNCCPGEITATIEITFNRITITEYEREAGCDCLCLFDVDYKIINLTPGQYTLKIIGLYTDPAEEPLEFVVNFQQTPSGTFCVNRNHYPWGV